MTGQHFTFHVLRFTSYVFHFTFYVLRFTFHSSLLTRHSSRLTPHLPLLLILLLFTGLTFYNSISLPLGEAPDETDHYQYLRFVARTGHPPFNEAERREAGFKGGLAPLYYGLTAWPIAWVGEDTPPDVRRVDSKPERFIPTDGLGLNRLVHTLDERWPWRGQPLAWQLVRFLSLPMAWVTLIATYALARRLFPGQKIIAVLAAGFVAFLPRFVISSAVINDDNLVFALIALLLLTQVIILQGNARPLLWACFGALLGLALITKYFSLILIPEVIFTLAARGGQGAGSGKQEAGSREQPFQEVSRGRRDAEERRSRGAEEQQVRPTFYVLRFTFYASRLTLHLSLFTRHASRLLPFLTALFLTAGPWFIFITLRFNRIDELGLIPGLAAALGEPQITEGLAGLLTGQAVRPPAATYPPAAWFGLLYRSFWFEYGWMKIFAPAWVYGLFTVFLGGAILGLIGKTWVETKRSGGAEEKITHHASRATHQAPARSLPVGRTTSYIPRPILSLLTLHLSLFLIVVLARYILSATLDTGQGRHLYPALPVIALFIAFGLYHLPFTIYNLQSGYLLLVTCYLLPALISLIPAAFIWPHYRSLPITITAPDDLKIEYRLNRPVTNKFFLAGFDTPPAASAGSVLPVRLYWRAEQEVNQDYLVSLCLQADEQRPAGCWRGHFVDGHYPARAWEAGDTIIDTVFIPIPACSRLEDRAYRLHLELWSLHPGSPAPQVETAPIFAQTLSPTISIRPTDSLPADLPPTTEFWQTNRRLAGPAILQMNEAVTQIYYATGDQPAATLEGATAGVRWRPLSQFETPLYLPCAGSPSPLAHATTFMAGADLPPDTYAPDGKPLELSLSLATRLRSFAPLTGTLNFSYTLSPLSLELPNQSRTRLTAQPTAAVYQLPISQSPNLPITIRWQPQRWMAEPLVISLKLLDKDFAAGGERIATLGDRYPNLLWAPTEIIEETYPLRLNPETPPGLYRLELSLIRQDESLPHGFTYLPVMENNVELGPNLYPLTIRLLDPAHDTPPPIPFFAQLGDSIQLLGYDLPQVTNPTSPFTIPLTLYWQATASIPADYTVFTQLIGPDGQVWAQWDNPPQAGRYPTSAWLENDNLVDRYNLSLREGYPMGEYRLLVGMYDPASGERLPATIKGRLQPDNAIELTRFAITP